MREIAILIKKKVRHCCTGSFLYQLVLPRGRKPISLRFSLPTATSDGNRRRLAPLWMDLARAHLDLMATRGLTFAPKISSNLNGHINGVSRHNRHDSERVNR
ncbi:hypothetical protein ALC62_09367 [Cyphomyrmex costatus]|uniref:Uncharacterized protein n=1 Tax=Cyphomyrmex costatus TaxID=456900 RepID=A0A195CG78_9HYME|nr:hypothetical protein ALC62_09367 [Cyphomyrmex costatus]